MFSRRRVTFPDGVTDMNKPETRTTEYAELWRGALAMKRLLEERKKRGKAS